VANKFRNRFLCDGRISQRSRMNRFARLLLEINIDLRLSFGAFIALSRVCLKQLGTVAKTEGLVFGS